MTFDEFVSERMATLLRFAVVLTGDVVTAEEIVQSVLARACERWDRIGSVEDVNAYVRRMVVNEYMSWHRRLARVRPFAHVELVDHAPDHAALYADRALLRAELDKLAPRQRAVLVLRYYQGLTDAEIAETLGCSAGTVRGYASRALAALRIEIVQPSTQDLSPTAKDPR